MEFLNSLKRIPITAAPMALALLVATSPVVADSEAAPRASSTSIEWNLGNAERATVTVSHPNGKVTRHEFEAGQTPRFEVYDAQGQALPDGVYNYEVVGSPGLRPNLRKRVEAAKSPEAAAEIAASGPRGYVRSGTFQVRGGRISLPEPGAGRRDQASPREDQVIHDDLIVEENLCVGFDCIINEAFGNDTIRLKENNLRIKFEDTSVGSFPGNDWQLTANDSPSGGSNKFSIEDVTGSRVPFTIVAGAATNSLFVDSASRLGLRTSTPVLDLHIHTSSTPGIRLEQNNSGGDVAQTWDIAGNAAHWFVRDVTSGSRLPFRIRPGAPTSSVDIASDGDVGIGTGSPAVKLHVLSSSSGAEAGQIRAENTNGTAAQRTMVSLLNKGQTRFSITNTNAALPAAGGYFFSHFDNGSFVIRPNGAGTGMAMDATGNITAEANLTVTGTFANPSSRSLKQAFVPVDPTAILERFATLPINEWTYRSDSRGLRHVGPTVEDFQSAFGLGTEGLYIFPMDVQGVTMAAVQGLHHKMMAIEGERDQLQQEVAALRSLVLQMAARLGVE